VTDSEQTSAPAAEAPAAAAATLGEQLRGARLSQDLSLEQLSTELRIEAKQLRALEENRFEQIGVPVFVKGYLKQYGTRLGLDVTALLALYHKQTTLADIQIQPSRTIKLRDSRQATPWVVVALLVLLVLAGGLAAWWWTGGTFALPDSLLTEPAAEPAPPASGTTPEPAARENFAPAPAPREALPAVDPAPAVQPGNDAPVVAVPAAATVVQSTPADSPLAAPVVAIRLQFTFEQESWAEVTDGRGERLLFGLNAAGRDVTVRGEPPFAVVLGNADSVRLIVDGAPYAIPTVGREGNLARFAVDVAEE
jgi:cytoskeleton protein RodZ